MFYLPPDDRESEIGTPEFNLLHPDHAWVSGSRRGSSQSEGHLEPDAVYQLGPDGSKSLPGSRRSSLLSQHGAEQRNGNYYIRCDSFYIYDLLTECLILDDEAPIQVYVNRGRRRSSVIRQDPEELLKSLKACRGELGRQMSLTSSEKRNSVSAQRRE